MTQQRTVFRRRSACGFTLVELLVVLGIMLLIIGVAVPSLKALSGTRSYEVAVNKISAYLDRARLIAVGQVQETGVMFYLDPQTQTVTMTLVYTVPPDQVGSSGQGPMDLNHYLNMVPNMGSEALPSGIGFQAIDASYVPGGSSGNSQFDYFIPGPAGSAPFIGDCIMFDAYGQSITVPCGFCCQMVSANNTPVPTDMYSLLYYVPGQPPPSSPPPYWVPPGSNNQYYSTVGFVLYDLNAFSTASSSENFNAGDQKQDAWLNGSDTNFTTGSSQLFLVNRNTGTLLKSE